MEDMQETVFETNSDLTDMDDDEFVIANLIEDISSDFYSWALIIDQVAYFQISVTSSAHS